MSGYGHTTFFSLPYPYTRNQVIKSSDVANLANAIDESLASVQGVATILTSQPTAAVASDGTGQTVSGSTSLVLQYDLAYWDTANLSNLPVANDRVVVGQGRWRIAGEVDFESDTFDPGSMRLSILANGLPLVRKKRTGYGGSSMSISIATSVAFSTNGNYIQLSYQNTAGGGSPTTGTVNGRLSVQRLGDAFPIL